MPPKDKRGLRGASPAGPLFAIANQHHQAGRFAEARTVYRQALAADPNHAPSLHYLGVVALQTGDNAAAVDLIGKAIARDPNDPQGHYNIALALRALGRNDDALAHLRRATALRPDYADAHFHLGSLSLQLGGAPDAVTHFQAAIRANPQFCDAYLNLAHVLMRFGKLHDALGVINRAFEVGAAEPRAELALDLVRRALAIEESADTRTLFVQCVRSLRVVPNLDYVRDLMVRALTEPWGRPADLAGAAASLIRQNEAVRGCIERVGRAWPRRLAADELYGPAGEAAIAQDALLRALLTSAPVRDIGLERLLTTMRAILLAAAPAARDLEFACALARQCFINEYAFAVGEAEAERAESARDTLAAALAGEADIAPQSLAAVASYAPLHGLADAERLLERTWPDAVSALIDQQVREPRAEREIGASIPALTAIADEVSRKVRAQYEENPYPRWIRTAPIGEPTTLDAYLKGRFEGFRPLNTPAPDMLIAGCGTGQHAASIALQFCDVRILAIDLSRASLAYAQRTTRALGLAGIEYAQADILALSGLDRRFDAIDSSGVLHHLADPFAGWRVLVSLLRPGGVMRLGLYSALGRREVAAVREFVAVRGYTAEASSIRRCRQELMNFAVGTPQRIIAETSDFFSTSECRDLLFHAQEHTLSLPDIMAFLAREALTFLGFEGCAAGYQRYAQAFGATAPTDLDRWALLEQQDPLLFFNMYQFWIQKPV
jgi:tetratricopeptide (TPR) repeat protein/2-polyprenyl-3-methyl-5-hydroxy-6-metoxy-1,4-benzoquinol methylase